MSGNATRIALIVGALAALTGTGVADPVARGPSAGETIMPPPAMFQGGAANVTEHLGAKLPLDAVFVNHDGKHVTLREVVTGDLPVILTFNYADCPMLCSQQLNGLTAAMPGAANRARVPGTETEATFVLGEHYRMVTISLEPNESLAKLQKMRGKYLDRVDALMGDAQGTSEDARRWTYLTGDASSVKQVADIVGFGYAYISERGEWAHPAAAIFVSTGGAITRYVYGIELADGVLAESIYKAGLAEPATATGFMLRCYHWDPSASDHSRAGVTALRIGAGSAVAMFVVFGIFQLIQLRRRKAWEVT